MLALLDNVLLPQHIVALKSATLALARDQPDPVERVRLGFREFARVLDVVPRAIDHAPQFPLDLFRFAHRVQAPPYSIHQRWLPVARGEK